MKEYLELLKEVREQGNYKDDRTGTGTYSLFGRQLRFDLSRGFPAVTTKRLFFKGVVIELLWFLSGSTKLDFLHDHGVHIWDAWELPIGGLGPVYGAQWRAWPTYGYRAGVECVKNVDQLAGVIEEIKRNPDSRRLVVSAWNVSELDQMALVPCHMIFQFYVLNGKLSCRFTMRSTDVGVGLPFNIASYALLTHMIAQVCDLEVGELVYSGGDVHVYANHIKQIDEQLSRKPFPGPKLWLNPEVRDIDGFTVDDIKLLGYKSHPPIKMPVAV